MTVITAVFSVIKLLLFKQLGNYFSFVLFKLHRKGSRLYAEISSSQLNVDYIVLISIARGIGQGTVPCGRALSGK